MGVGSISALGSVENPDLQDFITWRRHSLLCLVPLVGKNLLNTLGSFDLGFVVVGLGLLNDCTYNSIIIHKRSFYFCSHESAFPFM